MKHTPLYFIFPERCLSLSARCMEKPGGCTDSNNISRESHVSVKQRMLQSLMSLWKATLAQILSTLLSRDWTLTSSIFGSSWQCVRLGVLSVCPFCSAIVLGLLLGLGPLSSVVVQTEDLLWESLIPGRTVGKLMSLLYPKVLPGCM